VTPPFSLVALTLLIRIAWMERREQLTPCGPPDGGTFLFLLTFEERGTF